MTSATACFAAGLVCVDLRRLPRGYHQHWLTLDGHVTHEATINVTSRTTTVAARFQANPRPGYIEVRVVDKACMEEPQRGQHP